MDIDIANQLSYDSGHIASQSPPFRRPWGLSRWQSHPNAYACKAIIDENAPVCPRPRCGEEPGVRVVVMVVVMDDGQASACLMAAGTGTPSSLLPTHASGM
ncbi:unnamed protein product [Periconia digitata]|uniref:Uncharacterized protein n=1 Tax=Periconia digitata TaxID=1303443 RepID=A0A9W4UGB7_9PLEO|nr:unnamed protein product [Periconia digitata]